MLEKNQYPASFYEPIVDKTLSKIIAKNEEKSNDDNDNKEKP